MQAVFIGWRGENLHEYVHLPGIWPWEFEAFFDENDNVIGVDPNSPPAEYARYGPMRLKAGRVVELPEGDPDAMAVVNQSAQFAKPEFAQYIIDTHKAIESECEKNLWRKPLQYRERARELLFCELRKQGAIIGNALDPQFVADCGCGGPA